ncbi:metallophosphoesterase [Lacinutrix sp. Hel_I_90]|uniref:metallophosphoesterase n=1 Tax=Lacinutrix sp. Hel_I_90 TaxID=1249999 RepID=UPI0005C8ADE6|nr:metallophosphoesterase [Lacinutrix sp. Hel_I_90]
MKSNFLKHTHLIFIHALICFVFSSQMKSFAQQPVIYNTSKTDSVIYIDYSKAKQKHIKPIMFDGSDGPYIISDSLLYSVNSENKLLVSPLFRNDSLVVRTNNNAFYLNLKSNYTIPETVYALPEKLVVISDIEGNYEAFSGFLYSNEIIDINHNWIYGNGHLVLVGDFMDRGKNVTQILWLIYKLEQQAKKQNGVVHFILGNHEILNFHGDYRYNQDKYIKVAQEISQLKDKKEAIKYLYSKETELGKWLVTKNVIEKIGDYIFVHGGLSPDILDYKLGLEDINNLVRLRFSGLKNPEDKVINFLYSSRGPFWYRGFVMDRYTYDKIKTFELDAVLKYYNAKKIVIGHTPVETISTDFNGRIIRTDIRHGTKKFSGRTKGLLIENRQEFVIDDNCKKTALQH